MLEQVSLFEDNLISSSQNREALKQNKKHSTKTCNKCGAPIKDHFNFCSSCGHKLTKTCTNGHSNAMGAQYCTECGASLESNEGQARCNNEDTRVDVLAKNNIDIFDNEGIIRIFSLTQEELDCGIEECPCCRNPIKVAGPGGRFLNGVPMFTEHPEDNTGSLTICNKCGEASFAGTGYEEG
ncbi:double zinc ribbon domain-containing protein [Desulfitobacterium sp. AusDCA]|uniref:double zinc ribbon domain-containing protein n=1 Tax=Desulfitobacterium sp. AusDCA TaxID=3240383 RepID=UPI003DA71200